MGPLHASAPLAYFITFHTYGTWLPGDGRGSVDAHHRAYGAPLVGPSPGRQPEHTPERVMNDLKAWATRRVVEAGLRPHGTRLWVRHGSTRHLWRPEAVEAACEYVIAGQGERRERATR
jgi:hypothetical protein